MSIQYTPLLAVFLSLAGVGSANAATLAEFSFTSLNRVSSDTDADTTATDIADGAGLTGSYQEDNDAYYTFNGQLADPDTTPALRTSYGNVNTGSDNLADALFGNNYFTFTITANGGAAVDFTNLTLNLAKLGPVDVNDKPGTGPTAYVFAGDFSGGGPDSADVLGSVVVGAAKGDSGKWLSGGLHLTGLSGITGATEFRLYLDNGGAGNGGHRIILDEIVVNGTTSIPEPSTPFLISLTVLILLQRRRRTS